MWEFIIGGALAKKTWIFFAKKFDRQLAEAPQQVKRQCAYISEILHRIIDKQLINNTAASNALENVRDFVDKTTLIPAVEEFQESYTPWSTRNLEKLIKDRRGFTFKSHRDCLFPSYFKSHYTTHQQESSPMRLLNEPGAALRDAEIIREIVLPPSWTSDTFSKSLTIQETENLKTERAEFLKWYCWPGPDYSGPLLPDQTPKDFFRVLVNVISSDAVSECDAQQYAALRRCVFGTVLEWRAARQLVVTLRDRDVYEKNDIDVDLTRKIKNLHQQRAEAVWQVREALDILHPGGQFIKYGTDPVRAMAHMLHNALSDDFGVLVRSGVFGSAILHDLESELRENSLGFVWENINLSWRNNSTKRELLGTCMHILYRESRLRALPYATEEQLKSDLDSIIQRLSISSEDIEELTNRIGVCYNLLSKTDSDNWRDEKHKWQKATGDVFEALYRNKTPEPEKLVQTLWLQTPRTHLQEILYGLITKHKRLEAGLIAEN